MLKREELSNPNSCMGRALPDERTFVLLARDEIAPQVIREWCRLRCLHGKNNVKDPQIVEALECADLMNQERRKIRLALEVPRYTAQPSLPVEAAGPKEFRVGRSIGTTIYTAWEGQPLAWVPNNPTLASRIVELLNAAVPAPPADTATTLIKEQRDIGRLFCEREFALGDLEKANAEIDRLNGLLQPPVDPLEPAEPQDAAYMRGFADGSRGMLNAISTNSKPAEPQCKTCNGTELVNGETCWDCSGYDGQLGKPAQPVREWLVDWTCLLGYSGHREHAYDGKLIFSTEQEADDCIAGKMECSPQMTREPEDVKKWVRIKAGPWRDADTRAAEGKK